MTKDPGEMFYDAWRFLLLGNWGSPPIEWADSVEAGIYVQNHAVLDGDGNPCLYGPDASIVAGPWLAEHPRDLAALERGWPARQWPRARRCARPWRRPPPVVGRWRARPSTPSRDPLLSSPAGHYD
jgi:hypothetical protein